MHRGVHSGTLHACPGRPGLPRYVCVAPVHARHSFGVCASSCVPDIDMDPYAAQPTPASPAPFPLTLLPAKEKMTVVIGPEYGWPLLAAVGMGFHLFTMSLGVGGARYPAFKALYENKAKDKDFLALVEEHKKATGETSLPRGGYPDTGNGRFSALLPYSDWYQVRTRSMLAYIVVLILTSSLCSSTALNVHI